MSRTESSAASGVPPAAPSGGRRWLLPLLLGGGWLALLLALSPFDLPLSARVAAPEHWFGRLIQSHGTWPALACYLVALAHLLVPRWRRRFPFRARVSAAVLTQALVHTLAITDGLKLLWGRVRFVDLSTDRHDFTPVYQLGAGGGLSFPSGHVATACVCLPLVVLLWRTGRRRAAALAAAAIAIFAIVVAAGRIVYGAHYLTDTWFSLGLAALIAPVSIRLGDRYLALFDRSRDAPATRSDDGG